MIVENLIRSAVIYINVMILGPAEARKLKNIPLLSDKISRRINEMW